MFKRILKILIVIALTIFVVALIGDLYVRNDNRKECLKFHLGLPPYNTETYESERSLGAEPMSCIGEETTRQNCLDKAMSNWTLWKENQCGLAGGGKTDCCREGYKYFFGGKMEEKYNEEITSCNNQK